MPSVTIWLLRELNEKPITTWLILEKQFYLISKEKGSEYL
jgi:hypothetical protein